MRNAYERFTCECGESCTMLPSASTGKLAPITTKHYEGGNIEIDTDMFGNVVYRVAPKEAIASVPDYPRHLNHFSNCPIREQFRGRKP